MYYYNITFLGSCKDCKGTNFCYTVKKLKNFFILAIDKYLRKIDLLILLLIESGNYCAELLKKLWKQLIQQLLDLHSAECRKPNCQLS